jgi:hypothetical protein
MARRHLTIRSRCKCANGAIELILVNLLILKIFFLSLYLDTSIAVLFIVHITNGNTASLTNIHSIDRNGNEFLF